MTVKEICERFWKIEKELDLFENKIDGVYFWELIRFDVYNMIIKNLGIADQAHTKKNRIVNYIKALFLFIYNSLRRNPFFYRDEADILIFDHPRKIFIDGEYIDIYTKYFIDELKSSNQRYFVLESPYLMKHLTKNERYRKYTDFFSLYKNLYSFIKSIKLNKEEKILIKDIENYIYEDFSVNVNLTLLIIYNIKKFKSLYLCYDKIIKKLNIKKVYIVVSYGNHSLVAAAKNNNCEVIEFQHGTVTKYHLGYSYPNNLNNLNYFPDKILLFGEYWKRSCFFPIPEDKLISYGFAYFDLLRAKYANIQKDNNTVLFISQGTIGNNLSEIAFKLANLMPEYKILFKLHPGEFSRWKSEYPFLVKALKINNFSVIESEKNLYQLFSENQTVVGVYSTALFEALGMGCKVIICDLYGREYMDDLIDRNYVNLATNHKDVCSYIKKGIDQKIIDRKSIFG